MSRPHSPPGDTSTAPTTGTHGTLLAGALGPRETVSHAGCWPSPPRLTRSRRPLEAQAGGGAGAGEPSVPRGLPTPGEMGGSPGELRGPRGRRRRWRWRKAPLLLGGQAFSGLGGPVLTSGQEATLGPPPAATSNPAAAVSRPKGARSRKSRPHADVTDAAAAVRGC